MSVVDTTPRRTHRQAAGWAVKRGPRNYEARWYDHDGKRRCKTGFVRKSDAERFAREQAEAVEKIKATPANQYEPARPEAVNELLDVFLASWERGIGARGGRAPDAATVNKVKHQLKHARKAFGDRHPESLALIQLEDWRLELPAGSRHDIFRAFRQALTWSAKRKKLTINPTDGIENPPPKRHERSPSSPSRAGRRSRPWRTNLTLVIARFRSLTRARAFVPKS
jgi:hypothetical protein